LAFRTRDLRDQLDGAACSLDLLARRLRDVLRLDGNGSGDLAVAQDAQTVVAALDDAGAAALQ
jgi:hypothetical protein